MDEGRELEELIFEMMTFHYDQALARNLEDFERDVIGDLSKFNPTGFLGGELP